MSMFEAEHLPEVFLFVVQERFTTLEADILFKNLFIPGRVHFDQRRKNWDSGYLHLSCQEAYLKLWIQSPIAAKALRLDLEFLKNLNAYR